MITVYLGMYSLYICGISRNDKCMSVSAPIHLISLPLGVPSKHFSSCVGLDSRLTEPFEIRKTTLRLFKIWSHLAWSVWFKTCQSLASLGLVCCISKFVVAGRTYSMSKSASHDVVCPPTCSLAATTEMTTNDRMIWCCLISVMPVDVILCLIFNPNL